MSQWKGLLWKEWIIYRPFIYLAIIIDILGILVGPLIIQRIFSVEENYSIHVLIVSVILGCLHFLAMMFLFFSSLEREMKRPDIWFHNSASSFKLVGAKIVAMSLFTFLALVLIGIVTILASLFLSKNNMVPIFTVMKLELGLIFAVLFTAITFTIGIFSMWMVARLIRPFSIAISNGVAVIFYFVGFHYYEKFLDSHLYQKLTSYGEVKFPTMSLGELSSKDFYMTYQVSDHIFLGEVIFKVLFFTCLFIVSVNAFEKKVRG